VPEADDLRSPAIDEIDPSAKRRRDQSAVDRLDDVLVQCLKPGHRAAALVQFPPLRTQSLGQIRRQQSHGHHGHQVPMNDHAAPNTISPA
jgi:hypothetical protein